MENVESNQTEERQEQFKEGDLTDREKELAKEFGVEEKTVALIGRVAAELRAEADPEIIEDVPVVEPPGQIETETILQGDDEPDEADIAAIAENLRTQKKGLLAKGVRMALEQGGEAGEQPVRKCLTDDELAEKVADVGIMWPEIDEQLEEHIDQSILGKLRNLDYIARQKLMLLMTGLHRDQSNNRPESRKPGKSLRTLIPAIEYVEDAIAEEEFTQRVSDAVFGLSREDQEKLVEKLEAEQEVNA